MFIIDPAEYAQPFLRKVVAAHNEAEGRAADDFRAVAIGKRYVGSDPEKHPALRDRTGEFRTMLKGFGSGSGRISEVRYTGAELHEKFGFGAVGAQFGSIYDILWIN